MLIRSILFFLFLICCTVPIFAEANEEAKLIIGTSAFLDEDIPFDHFLIGASYGIQLTEKLRIEPQFLAAIGPGNDRDYAITGNIAYDLFQLEKMDFYVVAGAGILHQRNQFGTGPAFSANDATVNGGIGLKIHVSERIFIAPEFRMGFEPLFLGSISFGYKF